MAVFLGIDASNYTTSVAIYNSQTNQVTQVKKLLPVEKGAKGLRQSDAVFHHTVQLPQILEELFANNNITPQAVGASAVPMDEPGSYMPCFLVGDGIARALSCTFSIPYHRFSHQAGHIAAALFSAQRMELRNKKFIAFHVSGGTTQVLLVEPCKDKIFKTQVIARSLDLKAGQAVDRVGVMLGFDFPAGAALDLLSQKSTATFKIKPAMKGADCSLSGIENQCINMKNRGEREEDIALYCIEYIYSALQAMAESAIATYGDLPLVFSGGVMSNSIIKERMTAKFGAFFASPQFSSDNAAGIALLTHIKERL